MVSDVGWYAMSLATTVVPPAAGEDVSPLAAAVGAGVLLDPPEEQATVMAASPARARPWSTRFIDGSP
jgi:hypothetical protein